VVPCSWQRPGPIPLANDIPRSHFLTERWLYSLDLLDSKIRRAVYESPADVESLRALFDDHETKYIEAPEQ
jgi:hypothetical protein